jgi:hypothetical protein
MGNNRSIWPTVVGDMAPSYTKLVSHCCRGGKNIFLSRTANSLANRYSDTVTVVLYFNREKVYFSALRILIILLGIKHKTNQESDPKVNTDAKKGHH